MPVTGAPTRLGHSRDLPSRDANLPGHPCRALKKGCCVFCARNVPGGHNHGHASHNTPSPFGLIPAVQARHWVPCFGYPSPCDCLRCALARLRHVVTISAGAWPDEAFVHNCHGDITAFFWTNSPTVAQHNFERLLPASLAGDAPAYGRIHVPFLARRQHRTEMNILAQSAG